MEFITDAETANKHLCTRQKQRENNQTVVKMEAIPFRLKNVLTTLWILDYELKTNLKDL